MARWFEATLQSVVGIVLLGATLAGTHHSLKGHGALEAHGRTEIGQAPKRGITAVIISLEVVTRL